MSTKPTSSRKPILRSAPLLVGGLVLGFAIGRFSSPDPGPTAQGGSTSSASTVTDGRSALGPGHSAAATGFRSGQKSGPKVSLVELRRALDESDPVIATQRFATALQSITSAELSEAAKALWARAGDSREMNERKRLLGYRWGQLAGAKAVEFAQEQSGQGKVTAISAALAGWASADPAAAKAWIDGQGEPAVRLLYGFALVDGWARSDLAAATNHVLGLPDQPNNDRMMKIVAGEQVRQDPAGAGSWALGLPEGALRSTAIQEVATRLVWADPPAAIDWVAGIPESGQMQDSMSTAMGIWTRTDPASAGAYLTEMPEGAAKDQAVGAFSQAAATEDPGTSAAWAATISDATLREESLVAVARTWMRRDAEAARAWLPQSGLSEEALAKVVPR